MGVCGCQRARDQRRLGHNSEIAPIDRCYLLRQDYSLQTETNCQTPFIPCLPILDCHYCDGCFCSRRGQVWRLTAPDFASCIPSSRARGLRVFSRGRRVSLLEKFALMCGCRCDQDVCPGALHRRWWALGFCVLSAERQGEANTEIFRQAAVRLEEKSHAPPTQSYVSVRN